MLNNWIRPVRPDNEGTLAPGDYSTDANRDAAVLDVVDIDLIGHTPGPGQPENWLVAPDRAWRLVRRIEPSPSLLQSLREDVNDLWWAADRSDRIGVQQQARRQPQRSLVMVKPHNLRIRWGWEYNEWKDHWRVRSFAEFDHGGRHYNLNITDPVFIARACTPVPEKEADWFERRPPCRDDCLLCVSLTPPFHNDHCKVVATVLAAE